METWWNVGRWDRVAVECRRSGEVQVCHRHGEREDYIVRATLGVGVVNSLFLMEEQ